MSTQRKLKVRPAHPNEFFIFPKSPNKSDSPLMTHLVVVQNKIIVGFLSAEIIEAEMEIIQFGTCGLDEEITSLLLNYLQDIAILFKRSFLSVYIPETNSPVVNHFITFGFIAQRVLPNYFKVCDEIRFKRCLSTKMVFQRSNTGFSYATDLNLGTDVVDFKEIIYDESETPIRNT